jgi:hypothetical protein
MISYLDGFEQYGGISEGRLRMKVESDLRFTMRPRDPAYYVFGDGEDGVFAIGANERLFDYDDDRFYRAYKIAYDPPPILSGCRFDFQYAHVCYDGPGDPRCGAAASVEHAKREIDDLYDEGV